MARKRKSGAAEAQETESAEANGPESEQLDPEETQQFQVEERGVEDEVVGEEEEEEEEQGGGEDGDPDTMTEYKDDAVQGDSVEHEQQSEVDEKPLENAVSGNGSEGEEEDDEEEPLEKLLEPFSKEQLTLLIKDAVEKHPDIVENMLKLADADPAHRKIFVHGLGWEANDETITSVFGKYGEIEDCRVVRDKSSGKSKGYGFILFKKRDGARRALKQPQKFIEGRMTSCQLASAGSVHTPLQTVVPAGPESEYKQRKIYVSNVSAELDPKKVYDFFSQFGEIEEGPLGLDKQTGKPRGFCFFVYKDLESAKKALEEPHRDFEGQILHCHKAVDIPKQSKGNFNQQQSQPHEQKHHQQRNQGYYHQSAKKGRYSGRGRGAGHTGGHLEAHSAGPAMPFEGFNPAVTPAAIGQAVASVLANPGAGLGVGNMFGGIGASVNPQGAPPMNIGGYGGPGGAGVYGVQPGGQGGYGGQPRMGRGGVRPRMGRGGVRPRQGGAPYMGRGR